MKSRQVSIIKLLLSDINLTNKYLLKYFNISKRTLYYDIEKINKTISGYGQVINVDGIYKFYGDYLKLKNLLQKKNNEININEIILFIFNGTIKNINDLSLKYKISKSNCNFIIKSIKEKLSSLSFNLVYKNSYFIIGNEKEIYDFFIYLIMESNFEICIDSRVNSFNNNFELTDYSLQLLSKFINFIEYRINNGFRLKEYEYINEIDKFYFNNHIKSKFEDLNLFEIAYVTLFIASLSNLNDSLIEDDIKKFSVELVDKFLNITSFDLIDKDMFIHHLNRHLQSSYYRIKYKFPTFNPNLNQIKQKHLYIFQTLKQIIYSSKFVDFKDMRDEEIGFLSIYFGGNIHYFSLNPLKVIVVCPNGILASKTLKTQILSHIPNINLIETSSINKLENIKYDYIISTIKIPEYKNVLVVNSILNKNDISLLLEKLVPSTNYDKEKQFSKLVKLVEKYGIITDKENLRKDLYNFLNIDIKEEQPMLKEILKKENMYKISKCNDYKEAIFIASKPLLDKGIISNKYIEDMILAIEKYGPYIVLTDGLALPHSSSFNEVKEVSMSLLYVDNPVDLKGKMINVFLVLSTIDNHSHMKALASLSEMLYEKENLDIFLSGDLEKIHKLIQDRG